VGVGLITVIRQFRSAIFIFSASAQATPPLSKLLTSSSIHTGQRPILVSALLDTIRDAIGGAFRDGRNTRQLVVVLTVIVCYSSTENTSTTHTKLTCTTRRMARKRSVFWSVRGHAGALEGADSTTEKPALVSAETTSAGYRLWVAARVGRKSLWSLGTGGKRHETGCELTYKYCTILDPILVLYIVGHCRP
jgi:hypothetical protein